MSDKKLIVKRGSRVSLDIPAGSADTTEPDERRRSLTPADDDPTRYVFRGSDTIQVYDLGTRIATDGHVNGYVEIVFAGHVELLPGGIFHNVTEESLAEYDGALLGGLDPLGESAVAAGEKVTNTMLLNHLSDLPPIAYDLQGLVLYAGGVQSPVADEGEWKWRGRNRDATHWADSNREIKVAPATGGFAKRGPKRTYDRVAALDDGRYVPFDTGAPQWRVTDVPHFDGPAVPLKVEFPLRVYAVPKLVSGYEVSAGGAYVGISTGSALANVSIEEQGLHNAIRSPAIPGPFSDFVEERAMTEAMLNTRRQVTYFWPGQPQTQEVTFLPRRTLDNETLTAQSMAFGEAHYTPAGGFGWVPILSAGFGSPLSFQPFTQKAGHLSALLTSKGKTYYVWRTG